MLWGRAGLPGVFCSRALLGRVFRTISDVVQVIWTPLPKPREESFVVLMSGGHVRCLGGEPWGRGGEALDNPLSKRKVDGGMGEGNDKEDLRWVPRSRKKVPRPFEIPRLTKYRLHLYVLRSRPPIRPSALSRSMAATKKTIPIPIAFQSVVLASFSCGRFFKPCRCAPQFFLAFLLEPHATLTTQQSTIT